MARSTAELRDLVAEIEQPFIGGGQSVRTRQRQIRDVVYGRKDYTLSLPKLLLNPVSVPAYLLRHYKDTVTASLRRDVRLHLEPTGALKGDQETADKLEVFEAHCLLRLDPDGTLAETRRHYLTIGLFSSEWLEQRPYIAPEQASGEEDKDYVARVEVYRRQWWPWTLESKNPETVAWLESNREPTIAVCRYKLALVDIVERFGADYNARRDNPDRFLRIYKEHFAGLVPGDAQPLENLQDFWRQMIEICLVADGETIGYWADSPPGRRGRERYQPIGEGELANPFGRVPLLLSQGDYNPHESLAYRREGLLHSIIDIEDTRALLKSLFASQAMNAPREYQALPPEVLALDSDRLPQVRFVDDAGDPQLANAAGEIRQLSVSMDDNAAKLYETTTADAQVASPSLMLTSDIPHLAAIPATSLIMRNDEFNARVAGAVKSETAVLGTILNMIEYSMRYDRNAHREKGDPKRESDFPYSFTASGTERIQGKRSERGKAYEITPQDLDAEFKRIIEPIDDRASTRAANVDLAMKLQALKGLTDDEFLSMIRDDEDLTSFKETANKEEAFRSLAHVALEATKQSFVQFMARRDAKTPEQMQELQAIVQTVPPPALGPGQNGGGGGVIQMASPQQNSTTVAGTTETLT